MEGTNGETVGAGIGWAFGHSKSGEKYGIVAEAHGYKDGKSLKKELERKLREMASARRISINAIEFETKSMSVPKGLHGSVVAALIYLPRR
jgi:pyruvoyl-dependent arginine decarboxylase (PvlArgDC)